MKDVLLLVCLLSISATKVCSKPYQADSDGNCRNATTEYVPDDSNLCCQKCPPGYRIKEQCSEGTETVCEQCQPDTFMDGWNYAPNCRSCTKCKEKKGLQNDSQCSSTKNSKCVCRSGTFCVMGYDNPYCSECRKYTRCNIGDGVSVPGTPVSNVKCKACAAGTFSDTASHTDHCKPHTNCNGRAVLKEGDATSDTVCETSATEQPTVTTTLAAVSTSTVSHGARNSTQSARPSASTVEPNPSIRDQPPITQRDEILAIFTGCLFLIIFLIVPMCFYRRIRRKESISFHKDENGNCENGDKQFGQSYLEGSHITPFTVTSPEQVCLLEKGEATSDQSQCSNNSETLTRTDGYSTHESISPSQSTLALNNPISDLSEPMTLLTNVEPVSPQVSIPTQSSSQPTSPQIISPVTNNPHVNVNITLHIGNGSYGTSSLMPTDLKQEECVLPFGEEDESFSIPQQEAGKQSLISVQESTIYSDEDSCP